MKWATAPLRALMLTGAIALSVACPALAGPSATISAALSPEKLGAGTTIEFGFRIATTDGSVPPPLTNLEIRYPADINIVDSGLGLSSCTLATLEVIGPRGCSAEALMGYGSATAKIPVGQEILQETGQITAWMAPIEHGHLGLVFYAEAHNPVLAELSFPSIVLSAPPPYGLSLNIQVPLPPSLPDGPPPSVVSLNASIGPRDVTYYTHKHHKIVPYKPAGLILPTHCPHHGFPFAATFTFLDSTHTSASMTVPCPHRR